MHQRSSGSDQYFKASKLELERIREITSPSGSQSGCMLDSLEKLKKEKKVAAWTPALVYLFKMSQMILMSSQGWESLILIPVSGLPVEARMTHILQEAYLKQESTWQHFYNLDTLEWSLGLSNWCTVFPFSSWNHLGRWFSNLATFLVDVEYTILLTTFIWD